MSRSEFDPTAEQEVEHLGEQCTTLLREAERKDAEIASLRAVLERICDLDTEAGATMQYLARGTLIAIERKPQDVPRGDDWGSHPFLPEPKP